MLNMMDVFNFGDQRFIVFALNLSSVAITFSVVDSFYSNVSMS